MNEEQQKLVEENVEFAQKVAAVFAGESEGNRFDEALSDAYMGLCLAAERFTGENDADFRTYAWSCMRGSMLDGQKDRGFELQLDETAEESLVTVCLEAQHEPIGKPPELTNIEFKALKAVVLDGKTLEEYADASGTHFTTVAETVDRAKAKLQQLGKERLTEMLI